MLSIPAPTDRKDSYLVILPVELSTMNLLSQGDCTQWLCGCVVTVLARVVPLPFSLQSSRKAQQKFESSVQSSSEPRVFST